jgi:hypothetical protein
MEEEWLKLFVYDAEKDETKCLLCDVKKKPIKGKSVKNNLKRHLNNCHPDEAAENDALIKRKSDSSSEGSNEKKSLKEISKSDFLKYCVGLIVIDNIAYSKLENDTCLKKLISIHEGNCRIILTVEKLKKLVNASHDAVCSIMRDEMKGSLISIKADVGTRQSRSLLGITAQYFSRKQKKIVIRTLGKY